MIERFARSEALGRCVLWAIYAATDRFLQASSTLNREPYLNRDRVVRRQSTASG